MQRGSAQRQSRRLKLSIPKRRAIGFVVEKCGVTYECTRTVTGSVVHRQEVEVKGRGRKTDPATYGRGGHISSTMSGIAELIASEIINATR
jgi:hypothetical protein